MTALTDTIDALAKVPAKAMTAVQGHQIIDGGHANRTYLGASTEFAREKKVLVLKTGQCVSRNALCAAFH